MKLTSIFAAAASGLFLCSVSCERHSWEETKALHEKHGHGEGHGSEQKEGEPHGAHAADAEEAH